ncbi:MAG: hypothetical protein QM811_02285 [Pirellulales bacterium]
MLYLPEDTSAMMIVGSPLTTNFDFYFALGMFVLGAPGTGWLAASLLKRNG